MQAQHVMQRRERMRTQMPVAKEPAGAADSRQPYSKVSGGAAARQGGVAGQDDDCRAHLQHLVFDCLGVLAMLRDHDLQTPSLVLTLDATAVELALHNTL